MSFSSVGLLRCAHNTQEYPDKSDPDIIKPDRARKLTYGVYIMAFQQFKLTRSINQTRGIFDKYIYHPSNNDLLADILANGYFNESRYISSEDWIGSLIEISASDGYAIVRIVSGGVVGLYNSTDGGGGGTTYQSLTDTELFTGNAKKVPLVSDTETELVYAESFTFDDTNGWLGIGGAPTRALDIRPTTGDAGARIKSFDGLSTLVLDGYKLGADGSVSDISFRNNGDSVALIAATRDGFDDAGGLEFKTQNTGGNIETEFEIKPDGAIFAYDVSASTATSNLMRWDDVTGEIKYSTTPIQAGAPSGQASVALDDGTWINSAQVSGVPVYSYTEAAISAPGLILLDNSSLSLVTQITVSKEGINGADSSALFEKLTNGDVVSVSDYLDNTNFMIANISGDAIDAGLVYQIPVSVVDSNGALTTGELTSFNISPTAGRDKAYIILESTATQVMSTDQANPTVLDSWVVLDSNGISLQGDSIRNDTGRTISSMSGTIGIHPLVDGGGGDRLLSLTSERSPDGVTYTLNNQNRPIYTRNNSETYNTKESYLTNFVDGEYVQFIAFADGAMSIAPSSATFRNQAITGPAALWILVES